MGRIPDEIIDQIRDRVDIVDLVGRFVSLKRAGRNYKGLCPFHDEKTPSFNVAPDRQSFYCFGCQEGGNTFTFLMKVENLTFPEAARTLARECGIEIPEASSGDRGASERIFEANEFAQERYRAALNAEGNPGAAYLAQRGLDPETIQRFGLGFAPDRWEFMAQALRSKGIPVEIGERGGLLKARSSSRGHYDVLRGRVIFPIRDIRGRVVGFGGRALGADQEPKYLNTPESPVFRKSETLFGFPMALEPIRRSDRAVVVEGYFDLIALHRAGIEGVVATCGTALTTGHARNLRRRTKNVVLLFDGDEAGQKAVVRALTELLPAGLRVRAALLPPGDDPDTFLLREGPEALAALVDAAQPALEFAMHRAASRGVSTPFEKADAVAEVAPLLALVESAVERAEFERLLGLAVGTEARHVAEAVHAHRKGGDARSAIPLSPRERSAYERNVLQLARSLVDHPGLAHRVPRDEVEVLVPVRPLAELVATLVDAAASRPIDLEQIGSLLGDEARALLRLLAVSDVEADEEAAARTVDDTLRMLRRRRYKERQRDITRRLTEPGADQSALLLEKARLREEYEKSNHPPMGAH